MFFLKYVIRESRAICPYELRHSLDLSLLKKCPVLLFLQNASGNPSCNFPPRALHAKEAFQIWNYWKRFPEIPWPVKDWVTLIYFQLKGTSWKTDLDDFVDEFDSRHDKWRIKLHWGDDDINSNVGSARICVRIVWICFKCRVSAFHAGSKSQLLMNRGKFSVNIKMSNFVGNILQNQFNACCYILLSDTRSKRRCTPICGGALLL